MCSGSSDSGHFATASTICKQYQNQVLRLNRLILWELTRILAGETSVMPMREGAAYLAWAVMVYNSRRSIRSVRWLAYLDGLPCTVHMFEPSANASFQWHGHAAKSPAGDPLTSASAPPNFCGPQRLAPCCAVENCGDSSQLLWLSPLHQAQGANIGIMQAT